jgi:23S rRNA (uracil1939-C5)-methyltransferase
MINHCKHFGVCGGCALQNITYEEQLEAKKEKVRKLLEPFYAGEIKITPSPDTLYFRNKIELSFSRQVVWKEPPGSKKVKRDKTAPLEFENALGFRLKGRWDRCIDLRGCILFNGKVAALCSAVRVWAKENNLDYYDQRTHKGLLRNIILREGKNTGEGMLLLVTTAPFEPKGLKELVLNIYPNYSVLTAVNGGMSDGAGLSGVTALHGGVVIKEAVKIEGRDIFFELSPQSFFQTNTAAANLMYERVRGLAADFKPAVMYDLYGGAGSFSLTCADIAGKSLCVESVEAAVINGRKNAQINKIDNVSFFCDTVENFLTKNEISTHDSLIVLDPPRSGLHPKASEAVLNSGARYVLYISCNPVTLAENLRIIGKNYNVINTECFDFFPHTEHVETLAELKLK